MEEKAEARKKRGQITGQIEEQFQALTNTELIHLLADADPGNRTAAARLLGERKAEEAVPYLCSQLTKETALYSRIAISESLAAIGLTALPGLINLLGKVGQNQHQTLPERGFYKKSYPLPRDLAARTIIKIGESTLPLLERVMLTGDRDGRLEAIDAIGHIAFYTKATRSEAVLRSVYEAYQSDLVMRWKIIRAFQSFPTENVRQILLETIRHADLPELRWEAVRSLGQLGVAVPADVLSLAREDPCEEVRNMARFFL